MSLLPKNISFERVAINDIKSIADVVKWLSGFIKELDRWYSKFYDWTLNITTKTLTVGDSTNYTSFSATGQTMHGDARTVNDIWIDAGGIKAPGAKPATAVSHGILETPAWSFANENVQANEQSVSWSMRVPNRMDRSETQSIAVGWSADDADAGVCEWQLGYLWTKLGEDTGAAAEDTLYADGSAAVTADGMVLSQFTGIIAPDADDVCLHCKLKRLSSATANGGAESDTIANAVRLHGTCFSFTSNKLGTAI